MGRQYPSNEAEDIFGFQCGTLVRMTTLEKSGEVIWRHGLGDRLRKKQKGKTWKRVKERRYKGSLEKEVPDCMPETGVLHDVYSLAKNKCPFGLPLEYSTFDGLSGISYRKRACCIFISFFPQTGGHLALEQWSISKSINI